MSKKPLGALIIHGFTASLDCVREIEPPLKALGLPTRMPVLRGHGGASPEALRGVKWQDWLADSEAALNDLLTECDKAIVIGHSMGGLMALLLASRVPLVGNNLVEAGANLMAGKIDLPVRIDSLVLAAAAVQLTNPMAPGRPLHFLAPLVARLLKQWPMPPVYADPELAKFDTNYAYAPMDAVKTLLDCVEVTRKKLDQVIVPTLILQSRKDTSVALESVRMIYTGILTPAEEKKIVWFEKTEHEMFRDCERYAIIDVIANYARERMKQEQ